MDSYFLIKTDVMGLINAIKKTPKTTDTMHGTIITEKFDIPETFIAIISSVFLIFRKNQIPDNMSLAFFCLGFLINLFEEINFFKDFDVGINVPIMLSALFVPSMIYNMFPFVILISGIWFFLNGIETYLP